METFHNPGTIFFPSSASLDKRMRILEKLMSRKIFSINSSLFLAPMAGYTDSVFRKICKKFGADIMVSELLSSEALIRDDEVTLEMCGFDEVERPFGLQIFGADKDVMASAAKIVEERFKPDFIDLNMGCPARKVVRKGAGVALMKEPEKAAGIAEAVVKAVDLPVSAKIRTGWRAGAENVVEISRMLEDSGIAFITVHARSKDMGYGRPPVPEWIGKVTGAVNVPVVGNGGIAAPRDALEMFRNTGCHAVMIGHGALGTPWIFRHIKEVLATGNEPPPTPFSHRLDLFMRHFEEVLRLKGDRAAVLDLRKHFAYYSKGLRHGGAVREKLNRATTPGAVREIIEEACRSLVELEKTRGEEPRGEQNG